MSPAVFVTLEDVLAATRCVEAFARAGRPEAPEDVARLIRDRVGRYPAGRGPKAADHRRACLSLGAAAEAVLRETRIDQAAAPEPPSARRLLRAAAAVCAVLAEDEPPPVQPRGVSQKEIVP